jgi:hypothetical protein
LILLEPAAASNPRFTEEPEPSIESSEKFDLLRPNLPIDCTLELLFIGVQEYRFGYETGWTYDVC